jgi:hypothetical protein
MMKRFFVALLILAFATFPTLASDSACKRPKVQEHVKRAMMQADVICSLNYVVIDREEMGAKFPTFMSKCDDKEPPADWLKVYRTMAVQITAIEASKTTGHTCEARLYYTFKDLEGNDGVLGVGFFYSIDVDKEEGIEG